LAFLDTFKSTPREKIFLYKYLTNGFNQTRAALAAFNYSLGDGRKRAKALKNAATHGRQILNKFKIDDSTLLEITGVTKGMVYKTYGNALVARKITSSGISEPDHAIRLKAADKLETKFEREQARKGSKATQTQINVFNADPTQSARFNEGFREFLASQVGQTGQTDDDTPDT